MKLRYSTYDHCVYQTELHNYYRYTKWKNQERNERKKIKIKCNCLGIE